MAQTKDAGIARAVLISALVRSEPGAPEIVRDDATLFTRTLLRTCNICTNSNIKLCKSFIIKYIFPSSSRTGAFMKYLISLSKSFCPRDPDIRVDTTKPGEENEGLGKIVNGKVQQPPEPAFKRLHLLYIMHDVLAHCYSHVNGSIGGAHRPFGGEKLEQLRPDILKLGELAACGCGDKAASTYEMILDLLAYWKKMAIYTTDQLDQMHDRILLAHETDWEVLLSKLAKDEAHKVREGREIGEDETNWVLPEHHGVTNDPTAPWNELPAANGLWLKRTRGYPLRATSLPPGGMWIPNGGHEADTQLKKDVSNLYNEVIRCFDKYTNPDEVQDIDALGNIIWKDPDRPTRNYWGFTIDGIEKRKELAERFAEAANGYDEYGKPYASAQGMSDAVERARALAAERGRGVRRAPTSISWRADGH